MCNDLSKAMSGFQICQGRGNRSNEKQRTLQLESGRQCQCQISTSLSGMSGSTA